MRVRELLIMALQRVNVANGENVPADKLEKAFGYLKSALRLYSADSLITAFQSYYEFSIGKKEFTIGQWHLKKGRRIYKDEYESAEDFVNAVSYVDGRDYVDAGENLKKPQQVAADVWTWVNLPFDAACDFVPDVLVRDFGDSVSLNVFERESERWNKLKNIPLSSYFMLKNDEVCSCTPCGENREKVLVENGNGRYTIVYNRAMSLDKNDSIDLPSTHIELLVNKVCVGCARTAEKKAECAANVAELEKQIACINNIDRLPLREDW